MKSAIDQHSYYPGAKTRRSPGMWPTIVILVVVGFAGLSGLAIGYMGKMAAVVAAAVVMGVLSMILPLRHLVVLLLITAFLVMGQLTYFAGVTKAFWMPLLLGLVLLIRIPAELMRRNIRNSWQSPFQPMQSGGVRAAIALYFCTLAATTLIALNPPLQIFVSGKEYVFLWGLYLTIAAGLVHPGLLDKIWNALPWLLPLQLPIVLYQRFFVAARRAVLKIGAAWDAVVGAFGGDPEGGGMSGAMGIFVVICMTLTIVRWRKKLIPTWQCAVILLSGLITIMLAEVKFAVMMLPIALTVAFLQEFFRRPVFAIGASILAGTLAVGLLFAYELQYWSSTKQQKVGNYIEHVLASSFDSDFVNMKTGEMGRVAAITFWASEQKNIVQVLIGQGMGSSRRGGTVVGEAAQRYPFTIARSSLVILLWETGIIGTLAFLTILGAGFARAYKLSTDPHVPEQQQVILSISAAGIVMVFCELPYNTDALYSPQMQIMLMLFLGQIAMSGGLAFAKRKEINATLSHSNQKQQAR